MTGPSTQFRTAADTVEGIDIEATKVTIAVSVDDSDVDTSSSSTQTIETERVKLTVAGVIVDLGELKETEPDSGIFDDIGRRLEPRVTGKDANNPDAVEDQRPVRSRNRETSSP